ncbi:MULTISPECIES: conserved phage C-terminal domain-containing protein [unclassified Pseudocitrobacter]|uniref:conserved phage C-terminal domain-containing protein n=1 Tax=unclassified Pseudocitrobacter TaxID=2638778 RepID=UPI0023E3A452|nr:MULTISPECIES: conserved phage C-terminal domain-containing protein [unclassified Pseudocitrobacter]MDF3830941.1 conserved phage C-terminal domain-containing protein [Pseudocitrobacter sp. 2023EL-00150]MEC5371910.1 conserved phage C-terminal domain-containing protein [Pseudocitrobacter sp. MW920760]
MSSKLHGLVWECDIQPISRKAVIARLADFSSDEGYCWPAVDTIRRQVGAKSKNTVTTAIKELEKEGWITVMPRKAGGRDLSNGYQLNVEKIESEANLCRQLTKQARESRSLKFNPSNINPSKSDDSKSEESKKVILGGQNLEGEGSTVDPDPSLKPTTDPSVKNKTPCPVPSKPDDADSDPAVQVLDHFNQVTGSDYGRGGRNKTTLGYISGRLAEDYTAEDLKLVVDYLNAKWADDSKMSDYLRPKTLFGAENCAEYFEKAKKWRKSGSPKCVNGRWVKESDPVPVTRESYDNVDYALPENAGFRQ